MRKSILGIIFVALALVVGCGDTTTTGTDTTATTDTTTTADTTPNPTPDTASPTPSCNAIKQEGCGEGEKCAYPNDAKKASCVPAGEKAIGEECSGVGDCKDGTCLSLNDTGNYCYKFCGTKIHCDNAQCIELSNSPFKVCEIDVEYETCQLLAQDCSNASHGCYVTDKGAVCLPAGTAGTGDDCESVGDCAPGNVCINSRCLALCNVNDEDPCGDFKPCAGYYGSAGYCD